MTKLNKKLSISISIIVIIVYLISIIINNIFIHKYYLYEKKKIINTIGYEFENLDTDTLINNINNIEKNNNITVIYLPLYNINLNNVDNLNIEIINKFRKKDITLKKFWIDKDSLKVLEKGSVNKIYNQGKMKYSLLVKFIKKDNYLFAVSIPIEHSRETIQIINRFNIIIGTFSIVIITILTFILSNKIIKPIKKLKLLSNDISKLNFRKERINTNDEIEELADSINIMSEELEKAHNKLSKRNEELKSFISDTSHELKTPIALIKAYAIGIKDDLDDGTYIDTIIEQSENMSNLINKLLYLAKYDSKPLNICSFNISTNLLNIIKSYKLIAKEDELKFNLDIDNNVLINADEDSINIVLNNLISNAIKYNDDKEINIILKKYKDNICFSIENSINNDLEIDIESLWRPFYVLEKSRSKELSGTGLGLSIVKTILESHNFKHKVSIENNKIKFNIIFEENNP